MVTDFHQVFTEKKIDYLQFQMTTILGDLKMVEFPAKIWDDMVDSCGVDGSSLGFLKTEQSDLMALPDLDTFNPLPWNPRVGRFLCDLMDNQLKPHPMDPRGTLKRISKQAESMGYVLKTRPELEWYFVNQNMRPLNSNIHFENPYCDEGKYMDVSPFDLGNDLRLQITDDIQKMGVPVKTIHHECGPGQNEIEFNPASALVQADNVQTTKMIAKMHANKQNLICSFMPKPFPEMAGTGFHVHMILTDKATGKNVFTGADHNISDTLRYFIGGILAHVDGLTAIMNPLTNSYKRLVPGHEAPVYKAWGVANRTALLRIPGYEKKARVEFRALDGGANMYLSQALLLAAGLEGISKKIEPLSPPTTKNVEKLSKAEREQMGITQLPGSLGEALEQFAKDSFVRNTLGNDLVERFLEVKRQEWSAYLEAQKKGNEREWELEHYLVRV